jgi:hypothetical protein
MSKTIDYRRLIPIIQISESLLSQITESAQRPHGQEQVAVIVGKADFTKQKPVILFTRLDRFVGDDSEDEVPAAGLDEISAFVLFDPEGDLEWDSLLANYVESNQVTSNYTSNYYYQPLFTACYHRRLDFHCYLLTPNISITLTDCQTGRFSNETKKSLNYATYRHTREDGQIIQTTFAGICGLNDPRIVALCYSLGLTYVGKTIRARIEGCTYEIRVTMTDDILCCEGDATYEQGSAFICLKVQDFSDTIVETPVPEDNNFFVTDKLRIMQDALAKLSEQLSARESLQQDLLTRNTETNDSLQIILDHLKKGQQPEPVQISRMGLRRQVAISSPNPSLAVEMSMQWENPEMAPERVRRSVMLTPTDPIVGLSPSPASVRKDAVVRPGGENGYVPGNPAERWKSIRREDGYLDQRMESISGTGAGEQSFWLNPLSPGSKKFVEDLDLVNGK